MNPENKVSTGYMSKRDVRAFIGGESNPIGVTTLWDWMKKRDFPRPIYVTPKCPIWRKADVIAWLESHAEPTAEVKNGS